MTISPERLVPLEGTHNVRDLGGYQLADGNTTRWRAVLRGDGLFRMTPASQAQLVDIGVRAIIDLSGPHELGPEPSPFAVHDVVRYHNVPLYDQMAPLTALGQPLDMALRYRVALDQCGPRIAEVLRLVADAPEGAVLFHCTAGKDRTGIVSALLLTALGARRQTVVDDYALTGVLAGPLLARLRSAALARGTAPENVDSALASAADTMESMLAYLDSRHGGVDAYMTEIGVGPQTIERIGQRLVS